MVVDIRAERERAGLTQDEVARAAGIAQANLSAIESGKRKCSPLMVKRIQQAMRRPSQALADHREEVREAIREYGAENPRIFGSVARGTDGPGSDLDILVKVRPENAWRFVSLRPRLVEILGVDVDIVSENGLTQKSRQIFDEAVPL